MESLRQKDKVLPGDVLLAAAFISYIGAFDRKYRDELVQEHWLPFLKEHAVPMSEGMKGFVASGCIHGSCVFAVDSPCCNVLTLRSILPAPCVHQVCRIRLHC